MSIERVIDDDPKLKRVQAELASRSIKLLGPGMDEKSLEDLVAQFTEAQSKQAAQAKQADQAQG